MLRDPRRRFSGAAATLISLYVLSGCGSDPSSLSVSPDGGADAAPVRLGAHSDDSGDNLVFEVYSSRATRIELSLYAQPVGAEAALHYPLTPQSASNVWTVSVPRSEVAAAGITTAVYYGYRAWGPNWVYDPSWAPGSAAGFIADVDRDGNRFNPNKLLIDPHARELSHDPLEPDFTDSALYQSGPDARNRDSGPRAPKGIVVETAPLGGTPIARPFKDEIIYEVHVRGLTMADATVDAACRGTFAGAATRAAYLKSLGVTAVELLPVQETQNDLNGLRAGGHDNYWGYSTINYFSPDRRYACDKSPGGPTREFQSMTRAFHDAGIKVYLDMVFNHTAEGGLWNNDPDVSTLLSFRGLDNAAYYETSSDGLSFQDNTGCCGANVNAENSATADLIVDALEYWKDTMGVDGFRFDLASILANKCETGCFLFDDTPLAFTFRIAREAPARDDNGVGVDLISEPWASGSDTYQLGHFPLGWSDWNGQFRDTVRQIQNKPGMVAPGLLAARIAGSSDLFLGGGRRPAASLNYIDCHDGLTLRDLYSYDAPAEQFASSQNGSPSQQRQAARTGLAFAMLSAGVPMMQGGDEFYRTLGGNANADDMDSAASWLDWTNLNTYAPFYDFTRRLIAFRKAHPALRQAGWLRGEDTDGNGIKDITFYKSNGQEADATYLGDPASRFLAWRIDGAGTGDPAASILIAYNNSDMILPVPLPVRFQLPANLPGLKWYRAGNTGAFLEPQGNFADPGQEPLVSTGTYTLDNRSMVILIEK